MKKIFLLALCLSFGFTAMTAPASRAAEYAEGEVLLTVAPPGETERDEYLAQIASVADAKVVKVYSALSFTDEDPILMMIKSDTMTTKEMIALLEHDERVISASPNSTIHTI